MLILSQPSYDTDASAYFTTAGVTNTAGRQQVSRFVRGIKDLGLYNNMVCWPLRSSQNAGTGTTAYSLGGLGTFNGTLTNGPIWGDDGVVFDGSNDYISLPSNSFNTGNAATSIWAFSKNNSTSGRQVIISAGNQNLPTNSFTLEHPEYLENTSGSIAFTALSGSISGVTTSWKSVFIGNTSFGFFGYNGGSVTQTTLNNTLNKSGANNAIGRMDNPSQNYFNGIVGAVIRIDSTPTTTLNGQVYSLYKTTLGQGLGLP